jgi:hypothetical protein
VLSSNIHFLSSGGTSTGADVAMCVCLSLQKIGFERLAPGSTIQVYSNKATVQVYINSTADHMQTESTLLFSLAQAHFINACLRFQVKNH